AAREAREEAGLAISADHFVTLAHWMPPPEAPRRFSTWFFVAEAPADCEVTIDGHEIHEHVWITPEAALDRHADGEIELAPPPWPCSPVSERCRSGRTGRPAKALTGSHLSVGSNPTLSAPRWQHGGACAPRPVRWCGAVRPFSWGIRAFRPSLCRRVAFPLRAALDRRHHHPRGWVAPAPRLARRARPTSAVVVPAAAGGGKGRADPCPIRPPGTNHRGH